MVRRRIDEAARAMGGEVIAGDATGVWTGAALDSRRIAGGELFFALTGETTDGHRFVADAFGRGAAAAVVHREIDRELEPAPAPDAVPCLVRVSDTYAGLHDLVRALRRDLPEVMVGITGSVGKTTTKELTAAVLAERFRTARNPGNLNNLFGFPLAFLNVPDDTEVMVAELGMSFPGELGEVSALARPDGVVLTNVRPAHLENFPSVRAIAEAKAEIFRGLPSSSSAFVVANRDDPEVVRVTERWAESHRGDGDTRVLWYGLRGSTGEPGTRIRGRDVRAAILPDGRTGIRFTLEIRDPDAAGGPVGGEVEVPLHGRYNASNALAAAGVAHALGLGPEEIRRGLGRVRPGEHRGVVYRLDGGVVLVDDSYNSNPEALREALESAAELAGLRSGGAEGSEALPGAAKPLRRVAILGDMLELGPEADRFHREAGSRAAELGFDPVVGVGSLAEGLVVGAQAAGSEAIHLEDAAAAAEWTGRCLRSGDLVLIKGSRGVGLDRVVERVLAARGPAGRPSGGGA